MLISAGSFLGLNAVNRPSIGANLQFGGIGEERPNEVDSLTVNLTNLQIYPQYLRDTSGLSISTVLSIEGNGDTDKEVTELPFQNGEVINLEKIRDRSGVDLGNITMTGITADGDVLNGDVTVSISNSVVSKTYRRSFVISDGNTIFSDDFTGANGDTLGDDFLISEGLRRSRNDDTNGFTFKEDGSSNMEMTHDGSGTSNGFGEIALDISRLSNNKWTVNMEGQSWTYNSQENNYRVGVIDRTNGSNFCEFMETESTGVDPRVAGNNVNSSYSSNDVSFSGGTKYDWSFRMDNGTITVYKDGTEVFSKSGFPAGEYTWFVMNESDGDTSKGETHLLDRLEVLQ